MLSKGLKKERTDRSGKLNQFNARELGRKKTIYVLRCWTVNILRERKGSMCGFHYFRKGLSLVLRQIMLVL